MITSTIRIPEKMINDVMIGDVLNVQVRVFQIDYDTFPDGIDFATSKPKRFFNVFGETEKVTIRDTPETKETKCLKDREHMEVK